VVVQGRKSRLAVRKTYNKGITNETNRNDWNERACVMGLLYRDSTASATQYWARVSPRLRPPLKHLMTMSRAWIQDAF
jgi:hypothetical protein